MKLQYWLSSIYFIALVALFAPAQVSAQKIKYVTYFPIPYGQHSKLNVKTIALLGTKNEGNIKIGSSINDSSTLSVINGFSAENLNILSRDSSMPQAGAPDLVIGSVVSTPSGSTYGTLSVNGNVGVVSTIGTLNDLTAFGKAYITSAYWDGKGGFGKDAGGSANWPSDCRDLSWEQVKIKGTDVYKTYLTCVPNAIVETPDTPDETKTVYVPNTKQIHAAKYCRTEFFAMWNSWGAEYREDTRGQKKVRYYEYADTITKKSNYQTDNQCSCYPGDVGGMGGGGPQDADDVLPFAEAVSGFKRVGQIKLNDYTFSNKYNLNSCDTNLNDQQICDKYCTGISCNYRCVKQVNVAEACGPMLETNDCYCPAFGSGCGYCQNGTGQPMGGDCKRSECGRTVACVGSYQGRCGEMVIRNKYEPALGTAMMLSCTAKEVIIK